MSQVDIAAVKAYLLALQDDICSQLAAEDGGASFMEDAWDRPGGGGGRTRVISNGAVFEQGGVNFSHVFGDKLPPSATAQRPELAGRSFQALGVSLVIHPHNPLSADLTRQCALFRCGKRGRRAGVVVWWWV